MTDNIRTYVRELPILDVHEHHMPAVLLNPEVGLLDLLRQSYAGWTQERPYPLPGETREGDPMLEPSVQTTWTDVARFVEHSGSSTFVRNLIWSLTELYELDDEGITQGNWESLDREIRRRHADRDWVRSVLDRAGIRHIITDPYTDPMGDVRGTLGKRYSSVCRINAFALGWHPDACDHNGNQAHAMAKQLGCEVQTFDDYLAMLETLVDTMAARGHVALKNALAYDRTVNFDDVDENRAREAWGQRDPTPAQRKAFGDVVVDRLCRLAGERDIPCQVHLGSAQIRGSHPMNLAGLIERHPRTRFLLMHLAYPWSGDLLGLAFVYRNTWLDLTWAPLLSPTHFSRALHEAIEILPDESRLMIGGDNWHAEETYGAFTLARRLIGDVLAEKLEAGYFHAADAKRLARKILHDNAAEFFAIPT